MVSRQWQTRVIRICSIVAILAFITTLAAVPAAAQLPPLPENCTLGSHPSGSGAVYLICSPTEVPYNNNLVVYAHGYVAPNVEVGIPWDQLLLPDGTSIPGIITGMGFVFATTSYRQNGLAVKEGVDDLVELVGITEALLGAEGLGPPEHVYLTGVSEGGLITTLSAEKTQGTFDGAMAACGPVGDFQRQVNYWGDARVLFDYFFPRVIPGSPIDIPDDVMANWESVYVPQILVALQGDPYKAEQLLEVARVPRADNDPVADAEALIKLLWYNAFATNNAIEVLGGNPYDNSRRWYVGSDNDRKLNRKVARFTIDEKALQEIEAHYQTSGDFDIPVVTLHTLRDPVTPYWHELIYRWKIITNGDLLLHINIPTLEYGHCNFTAEQAVLALGLLVYRVEGQFLPQAEPLMMAPDINVDWPEFMGTYDLAR